MDSWASEVIELCFPVLPHDENRKFTIPTVLEGILSRSKSELWISGISCCVLLIETAQSKDLFERKFSSYIQSLIELTKILSVGMKSGKLEIESVYKCLYKSDSVKENRLKGIPSIPALFFLMDEILVDGNEFPPFVALGGELLEESFNLLATTKECKHPTQFYVIYLVGLIIEVVCGKRIVKVISFFQEKIKKFFIDVLTKHKLLAAQAPELYFFLVCIFFRSFQAFGAWPEGKQMVANILSKASLSASCLQNPEFLYFIESTKYIITENEEYRVIVMDIIQRRFCDMRIPKIFSEFCAQEFSKEDPGNLFEVLFQKRFRSLILQFQI
eukprot:GHVP01064666.1.p1 GENE.GHVP01064666.1~~GHVP01064666.1.p1  ORF type:complete len:329 (-),score=59.22 GHVP01064666.1:12-998(-)